jgi:hypothetical protein
MKNLIATVVLALTSLTANATSFECKRAAYYPNVILSTVSSFHSASTLVEMTFTNEKMTIKSNTKEMGEVVVRDFDLSDVKKINLDWHGASRLIRVATPNDVFTVLISCSGKDDIMKMISDKFDLGYKGYEPSTAPVVGG